MNGVGFRFDSGRFCEEIYFRWWCEFWWVLLSGVFF